MNVDDIGITLRLCKQSDGHLRAIADVEVKLGAVGSIVVSGFCVLESDGKGPWVSPPQHKGKSKYFDVVALRGPIKQLVYTAILNEYEAQTKASCE